MISLKRYILLLFFIFPLLSIAQTGKIDSSNIVTLRIDPDGARGAAVSQVFDEVKFIPLETTKESLFGSISTLKIINKHFLIFDYDTRSVLIFSSEGKFRAKLNATKIAQDKNDKSKTDFYGFMTENIDGVDLIKIFTEKYFYYFNLDGKQLKKTSTKNFRYLNEIKLADSVTKVRQHYVYRKEKDSVVHEIGIINKKDSIGYFSFLPKRYETDEFWGSGKSVYDYGVKNELIFINYYDYNLYKITPTKLSLAYRIIFPANNSLPKDFSTNPAYIKKRGEYFQNNPKVFYGLSDPYLFGDNLFLKMSNFGFEPSLKKAIIYNLKSGEITSISDIEPDERSSFLPVTDASGYFYDFKNKGFHLYDEGYLYTSYSSLAMFTFKEQLSDKYKDFSPEMANYFKTQDKKSNPIIIQLKPKTN